MMTNTQRLFVGLAALLLLFSAALNHFGPRPGEESLRSSAIRAAELLAAIYPVPADVRIGVVDMGEGVWGEAFLDKDNEIFWIAIDDDVRPGFEALELICHEWAHGMVWFDQEPGESDHHPRWGMAYAACYRLMFEGSR